MNEDVPDDLAVAARKLTKGQKHRGVRMLWMEKLIINKTKVEIYHEEKKTEKK